MKLDNWQHYYHLFNQIYGKNSQADLPRAGRPVPTRNQESSSREN